MPSHPSQEVAEYVINRGVCEGYKRKSDMGIFSKIHAYVLINTRREFIHLRRLLMQTRRFLEILEIGCFVTKNFYFYLLIFYLFLNLHILLLGQNILRTFSMKKSVFINPFVD